ncbi:hypothetical protein O6H91_07G035500 [Diphasiastrum complanatum]|nr:hypothetical protein O6H91_07G035500 [Diphasiastrum complanatum]KAJ7548979.1 hypothetical protein O6H91_07G035500 [Diphasiastrum complanatum]KAJ7548980.1 hypothetical protein O6H91_07G035500 [Diphasiastrum complanatum]
MHKLRHDIDGLLASIPEADYSDAAINVDGISVPVHRCVLAARNSFFRTVFSTRCSPLLEKSKEALCSKQEFDINQLVTSGRIGYKPLMIALRYFYGGLLKGVNEACSVSCMDSLCSHICCWPVIDTYLELLCAASVFDISELKTLSEQRLLDVVEKAQIEDVLQIVVAALRNGATDLKELCIQALASSDIEPLVFEKRLPEEIYQQITALRLRLGLLDSIYSDSFQDKQCRRIYKALDLHDIELVQLLLTESRLTVDSAYALHYAASYCDSKTTAELMDLPVADINGRDRRGYTVLHVATMRRDPEIIGSVVEKGANPLDLTPDGLTALQISKRLTRNSELNGRMETREDYLRNKICVEILEQADKENPLSVFPVVGERELFMRLLYLENRVALARLLFPREAKVVLRLSHLDGTQEFTGFKSGAKREANLNRSRESSMSFSSELESVYVPFCMDKTLIQRVEALQRAVNVGQRFFPRCTAILNKFMDDGSFEHACIQDRRIPGHTKNGIHISHDIEIDDILAETFCELQQ